MCHTYLAQLSKIFVYLIKDNHFLFATYYYEEIKKDNKKTDRYTAVFIELLKQIIIKVPDFTWPGKLRSK